MSRRPDHIPRRKAFTRPVKAAVLQRSAGMCEALGCDRVGRDFDHIRPVAIGGDNSYDNCQLLCRPCNAAKGIVEGRDAAKADRQGGRSGQYARRQRAKEEGRHRPIAGRGFDKGWTKRMDGTTIKRETKP
jgi:5-methylcytosine-specific restriction endonuclease McrA